MSRALLAVLAALPLLAASWGEVADLAERAGEDPVARDALHAVTEIEGVPVEMARLLGPPEGSASERLGALARLASSSGAGLDAAAVRAEVEDILSDPAYADPREPLIERLLGPVYDWFERMVAWVSDNVLRFLGRLLALLDLAVLAWLGPLILGLATAVTVLILARRRAREIERRATIERILELGTDPAVLEDLAIQAEDEGRYSETIRLRFVVGLLRLDAAGRIDFYPGLSNVSISEALGQPVFDELSTQFDRVVYGRQPARAGDARRSAELWSELLGVRA